MKLPARIGLIGCGDISSRYIENIAKIPELELAACADLIPAAAERQGEKYGIAALAQNELLASPDVDIVLSLASPNAHFEVCKAGLDAGKPVYTEKPLAATFAEGKELVELAEAKNLRLGSAPDTFLGAGYQSARAYLDEGIIGEPVAVNAFLVWRGHEYWHANPTFYYKPGAGPMLDMGVYYLTALVHLLGPVRRVTGSTRTTWDEREIHSEPFKGQIIEVEVPTYLAGILDFECGAIGTLITTFDAQASGLPDIELYGATGTLNLPDPNTFGGPVQLRRTPSDDWQDLPLRFGHSDRSRGIGTADMAVSMTEAAAHRASAEMALHVLESMEAVQVASETGRHVDLTTRCGRPQPLPEGEYAGVRPAA